jgi:hypothetical protein
MAKLERKQQRRGQAGPGRTTPGAGEGRATLLKAVHVESSLMGGGQRHVWENEGTFVIGMIIARLTLMPGPRHISGLQQQRQISRLLFCRLLPPPLWPRP